jgi:starch synthase
MDRLNIAFITPEAIPYVKTGGLADISGTLPEHLARQGHSVKLFLPLYRQIKRTHSDLKKIAGDIICRVGGKEQKGELYRPAGSTNGIEVIFIANDFYFDRPELYSDPSTGQDYSDNDERFIFFSQAVLQGLMALDRPPDILHANDWQSALVPSYLKTLYRDDAFFEKSRTIFTIHNMGYKGEFPAETFPKIGIDEEYFEPTGPFEYWGMVSLMKAAIMFADHVTTVSPTYALEIQSSSDFGMGLEGVLKDRAASLTGILNGVDYNIWSPQKDKLIPSRYFHANLSGKKKNKLELLHRAGLPLRMEQPLLGIISRLDNQKGFDLIAEIFDELMKENLQFVLLGTGNEKYHRFFSQKETEYSTKFRAYLAFDNTLAHLIEAGADIFLMPSRYEPCGLNQMYSLKYGTVPVVRKTGGLADTVVDFDEESRQGTGFVFENYDADELLKTLRRAIRLFGRKRLWYKIVKQGMMMDYSWGKSAEEYTELYRRVLEIEKLQPVRGRI